MESKIKYKDEELELVEDFIDVGYMAENIEVLDFYGKAKDIKRSNEDKSMTLLISFPTASNGFYKEIIQIDKFMNDIVVPINCYLLFNSECEEMTALKNTLEKFEIVYDKEEDFGNMYGTKLISGSLEDKLTKSLFLISKDGAIFYLDMPSDLEKELDLERLKIELNKAYVSYTGVGCHG
ncbi:MAG: hypothetical protein U9R16_09465 [Campylobacterota bacterium]|nr:hypothetical protein [Campylobacterota bacterium]